MSESRSNYVQQHTSAACSELSQMYNVHPVDIRQPKFRCACDIWVCPAFSVQLD